MALTAKDVADKKFGTSRLGSRGYSETEVDEFLDEVQGELSRLHRENEELRAKLQSAQRAAATSAPAPAVDRPGPDGGSEERATSLLALAQRTAEQHVAEARAEGERLLAEGRKRAEELRADAEEKYRQSLSALQQKRAELEAQVRDLQGFEGDYRNRLRGFLQGKLRELDSAGPASGDGTSAEAIDLRPGQQPAGGDSTRASSTARGKQG